MRILVAVNVAVPPPPAVGRFSLKERKPTWVSSKVLVTIMVTRIMILIMTTIIGSCSVDDNDYDDDDDGDVDDVNNEDYVDEEHLLLIRGCSGPLDLAVTAFSAHACRVVLFNDCE